MKKTFQKLVSTIGGEARYSGRDKTMYVHGVPESYRWLLEDNKQELKFKVVYQ